MIIHDVEQRTPEWLQLRLGIPTASEFRRIITTVKGDLSKSAKDYAYELVAETLLSRPLETPFRNVFAMERGKLLEPQAVKQYEFSTRTQTRAVGFITTDDGRIGCSPDRLIIGERRGVEIKCCLDAGHMGLRIGGPDDDYRQQCQGIMAVAELESLDLYGWHPELPDVLIRKQRDEPYIAKMSAALREFLDLRDAMLAKERASGFFAERAVKEAA